MREVVKDWNSLYSGHPSVTSYPCTRKHGNTHDPPKWSCMENVTVLNTNLFQTVWLQMLANFWFKKKCFICVKHQHPTNLASTPVFTQLAVKTKTPLYIFHHENRTPTDLTPQQAGLRKRQAYRRPAAAKKKKNWLSGRRGQNWFVSGFVSSRETLFAFHIIRQKHNVWTTENTCQHLKKQDDHEGGFKKKSICIIHKPDCKHARTCLNPRTQMHILQT